MGPGVEVEIPPKKSLVMDFWYEDADKKVQAARFLAKFRGLGVHFEIDNRGGPGGHYGREGSGAVVSRNTTASPQKILIWFAFKYNYEWKDDFI